MYPSLSELHVVLVVRGVSQMALLGTRVEETAAAAEASSDKVSAVSSTTKTLGVQLEELQGKTAAEIPALDQKVLLFLF